MGHNEYGVDKSTEAILPAAYICVYVVGARPGGRRESRWTGAVGRAGARDRFVRSRGIFADLQGIFSQLSTTVVEH